MIKAKNIAPGLYYVGVNDRTKHLFENLWPLPQGVSYNSYLLVDKQTVLIDTVDTCYSDIFFDKLDSALAGRSLDYLVINHMEPDHSGSLAFLRSKYPEVKIVGNARTLDMLKGYYGITENTMAVKEGEELSIGAKTLRFYLTPMVHWPETMMTYEVSGKVLFAGDAFGTFGTLDGGVVDTALDSDRYWDEMIRYYSNIVGKYGNPVQKALAKLQGVEIDVICSTHGPVWKDKENIQEVISLYDRLSRYDADKGVVIVYGTMYGHTEQIAEAIASELSEQGVRNIVMHNASKSDASYIIRDIFKYKGLIIGSPTYNNGLYPQIEAILSKIEGRDMKNRVFAYFGSFSWAGAAVKRLAAFAETSGFEPAGNPVEMKQAPSQETFDACAALAQAVAEKL